MLHGLNLNLADPTSQNSTSPEMQDKVEKDGEVKGNTGFTPSRLSGENARPKNRLTQIQDEPAQNAAKVAQVRVMPEQHAEKPARTPQYRASRGNTCSMGRNE